MVTVWARPRHTLLVDLNFSVSLSRYSNTRTTSDSNNFGVFRFTYTNREGALHVRVYLGNPL